MQRKLLLYSVLAIVGLALNYEYYSPPLPPQIKEIIVYLEKRYDLKDEKVVVSFSTTPYRIDKLQPILDNLYEQNMRIDNIYLSVPHFFRRDNLAYDIPQYLIDDDRVTILRTDDYGPATKVFGVLEQGNLAEDTIIITVDDDIHYPNNLVLDLAHKAHEFPDSAVGTAGVNIDYKEDGRIRGPGQGIVYSKVPDGKVAILLGYAGVAYRRFFFDNVLAEHKKAPLECYMNDDFYIGFYLEKHGVPRRRVITKDLSCSDIDVNIALGQQDDALFKVTPNRHHTDFVCLEYMRSIDPDVNY